MFIGCNVALEQFALQFSKDLVVAGNVNVTAIFVCNFVLSTFDNNPRLLLIATKFLSKFFDGLLLPIIQDHNLLSGLRNHLHGCLACFFPPLPFPPFEFPFL